MSIRIRSTGSPLLAIDSASSPLAALTIEYPPSSSRYSTSCMFMSLSSTTRTRALLIRSAGFLERRVLHRRFGVGLGEELRIEFDLGGLAHGLDLIERGLLLDALADALPHLLERPGGVLADLEDVDAVTRRDGIADLAGLEFAHMRFKLRREHARAERPEDTAAIGAAGVVRVLLRETGKIAAALQLLGDRLRLLHGILPAQRRSAARGDAAALIRDEDVAQLRGLEVLLVLVVELQHFLVRRGRRNLLGGGRGHDAGAIGGQLRGYLRILIHAELVPF